MHSNHWPFSKSVSWMELKTPMSFSAGGWRVRLPRETGSRDSIFLCVIVEFPTRALIEPRRRGERMVAGWVGSEIADTVQPRPVRRSQLPASCNPRIAKSQDLQVLAVS